MHRDRVHVLLGEPLDEPVGAALGPDEDERQPALRVAQLVDERGDLGLVRDAVEAVVDGADPLRGRLVLAPDGVGRVGGGDPADLAVERRGEQQRLAVVRRHPDDPVDDGLEAHVEHPVGLVEDEELDRVERDGAALDQVEQPARRGDEHVRAPGLLGLRVDADAAVDGGDAEVARLHDAGELVDDLGGELAGRGEDEGGRPGGVRVDEVGQRHAEGERLARARGGLDQHVAAVEHVGDDERLDRERTVEAAPRECAGDGLGHAEIGEG